MSAKRFWCLDEYKGETSPIVDGKFAPTNGWLCDKLNELYEKNRDGEECYRKLLEKYDTLKEENERLKKYIEEHSIDEKLFDDLYFNQVGGI